MSHGAPRATSGTPTQLRLAKAHPQLPWRWSREAAAVSNSLGLSDAEAKWHLLLPAPGLSLSGTPYLSLPEHRN